MDQFDYNPFYSMHLWCWFKFCKSLLHEYNMQLFGVSCTTSSITTFEVLLMSTVLCNFMNFVDNWLEELREWVSTRKCYIFNGSFDWNNPPPPFPLPLSNLNKVHFRTNQFGHVHKDRNQVLNQWTIQLYGDKIFNLLIWNIYFKSWCTSR